MLFMPYTELPYGTTDWLQIGKRVRQGCILSPCLFNLYAEYIMRNAGLEEAQAGIKISTQEVWVFAPDPWVRLRGLPLPLLPLPPPLLLLSQASRTPRPWCPVCRNRDSVT